jgi:transcriptional regulator with XRE-family HTH domain
MSKSTPLEEFPNRLRKAREQIRKLSQSELAEKTGLQSSAISHFESGTRKPSFHNLRRLADALKVSTDYLLGRTDEIAGPATADKMHKDYDNLSEADRSLADDILGILQKRNK